MTPPRRRRHVIVAKHGRDLLAGVAAPRSRNQSRPPLEARGYRRQPRNSVVLFVVCFKNRARNCEHNQSHTTKVRRPLAHHASPFGLRVAQPRFA